MTTASPRLLRVPPFERGITLGDFLVPVRIGERVSSRVRHTALIVIGALLIVAGARVSFQVPAVTLPFGLYLPDNPYVPITLQTFGVLLSGAALGFRRGFAASGLYLLLGAVGLPVFAYDPKIHDYASGIGRIATIHDGQLVLGARGGYLVGFVVAGALVGRLAELGWDRKLGGAIVAMLVASVAIYAFGLPWLAVAAHLSASDTLLFGLYPFIPGDLLKLLAAAGLLPAAWWVVRRRRGER